ncbi:unnamed protein product [Rangifer tarandus platyrhynchus]|uniref:Uncharacterized protein n=1 Tax=Rangifer tarandus platyrhynchus TaxID=3082113 RepID=A0ABN8YNS6_RANTA|nr:unnamed protein product [Rangifer tarandus platyrhynchus]
MGLFGAGAAVCSSTSFYRRPFRLGGKYECLFSRGLRPALLEETGALKGKKSAWTPPPPTVPAAALCPHTIPSRAPGRSDAGESVAEGLWPGTGGLRRAHKDAALAFDE